VIATFDKSEGEWDEMSWAFIGQPVKSCGPYFVLVTLNWELFAAKVRDQGCDEPHSPSHSWTVSK
jgi:hypothetical protein